MVFLAVTSSSSLSSLQFLPRPKTPKLSFSSSSLLPFLQRRKNYQLSSLVAAQNDKKSSKEVKKEAEEVEVEAEEEFPRIQENALDLVEFTQVIPGPVTQAIPGLRVGQSKLPWILTVPLAYFGITFVITFVKTVKKFNSPKHKCRKLATDEDADKLRLHTLSEVGDMD